MSNCTEINAAFYDASCYVYYRYESVMSVLLISNFRPVLNVVCFLLGNFPDVWILYADVSEHSVFSIFIGW